jgi:hypothetical protein
MSGSETLLRGAGPLAYDDDAPLDVIVEEMPVSSFWRFRARGSGGFARRVWETLGLPGRRNWEPKEFVIREYGLTRSCRKR